MEGRRAYGSLGMEEEIMFKNISWSRGFFRLWVIYGLVVIGITGWSTYQDRPNIPKGFWDIPTPKFITEREKLNFLRQKKGMIIISARIRKKYPEYRKLEVQELLRNVHERFYSDLSQDEFGEALSKKYFDAPNEAKYQEAQKFVNSYFDNQKSRSLKRQIGNIQGGLAFLIVPLITGLLIKWILLGFRNKEVS